MQQGTITLIVAVAGIAGTLLSGTVVQWMTRSSERKQWLRNCHIQEYRELLGALASAYMAFAYIYEIGQLGIADSPELQLIAERSLIDSFRTLKDRILIADEIESTNTLVEWDTAIQNFRRTRDGHLFAERFMSINKTLADLARAAVNRPNRLR